MQDVTIAEVADISQLLSLINSAYRGEAAKKGWTHEADLIDGTARADREYLEHLMQDSKAVILKYSAENKIKGCVYLQQQEEEVYLGMLSVDPAEQGSGIGKILLNESEVWAKSQDCTAIIMNVISVREELINWYKRRGYEDSGVRSPFPSETRFGTPKQPVEFMVLKKNLH